MGFICATKKLRPALFLGMDKGFGLDFMGVHHIEVGGSNLLRGLGKLLGTGTATSAAVKAALRQSLQI
jgi:hypothetical protein